MSGKRLNTMTSSQQYAGDSPVSTRTRNAGNVGAKRKGVAVLGMSSSESACPPSSTAEVPEVSLEDLQAARNAFYLKYICMPKKKSKMRRTLQEPLTNYQKRTLVDRYIAARKRNEGLDYKELSTKTVFDAFISHPEELKKHGDKLLLEFYQLYEEDQAQIDQLEGSAASTVAAAAEEQPSMGEESQEQHACDPQTPYEKAIDNILQHLCQFYEDDQAQINQLEGSTASSVAAAAEGQSSMGEESQEESEDATPDPQSPEKINLKVAVALQKIQMAETLLKEAQDTLNHVKD